MWNTSACTKLYTCSHCGQTFKAKSTDTSVTCPYCYTYFFYTYSLTSSYVW